MIGLRPLVRKSALLPNNLKRSIAEGLKEAAFLIEAEAKKKLTTGETRAIDTGRLRADTVVREISAFRATIAPLVNYAIYVHEGTNRMRPRPFLEKAVEGSTREISRIFGKRIKAAIKLR